jgi:hypothetical protein
VVDKHTRALAMPRIYLRPNGSDSGCVAKLPDSFAELLRLADAKLSSLGGPCKRVFTASKAGADEILEEDFELIEPNDVLYVSAGEDWVAPPVQPVPSADVPPAAPAAEPMVVDATAEGADAPSAAAPGAEAQGEESEEEEQTFEDLFEVAGIIGHRKGADQLTEYLVVWRGYEEEENTVRAAARSPPARADTSMPARDVPGALTR